MRHLRSIWVPTAILLALLPLLIGLGYWQLQRAGEKHSLQQEYDLRVEAPPQRLAQTLQSAENLRFRRIVARGRYDPDHQVLIDNRVHNGTAGYHVITPLQIEGGNTRVLVNRGWVALGASRAQLPNVETPNEIQEIRGVAVMPSEKVFTLGKPASVGQGWQSVWSHLDMKRYQDSVSFSVQPVVVLLDADVAHGFTREWTRLGAGIAVHQGYAFQWFALAALTLVILGVMWQRAYRRQRRTV